MLILRNCRLIKDLTEDYSKQYADILLGTIPPGRSELCRGLVSGSDPTNTTGNDSDNGRMVKEPL